MFRMLPSGAFQKLHCPLYPPRDANFYILRDNLSKGSLVVSQRLLNTMLVVFNYDRVSMRARFFFGPWYLKSPGLIKVGGG